MMDKNISLDNLHSNIITWLSAANSKLNQEEKEKLYKNLITEEYRESVSANSEAEEYSELMDLLWVTISYCFYKKYDITLGLQTLISSNSKKLQNPVYDSITKKLLKNANYSRPDWEAILEKSRKGKE